ncbi:MAG: endonuclease III [Candidatus Fermentibacteraceae bacterium]|nr:endonuclease III [Candidatus Fermentibacteraceae bacterium]MBN2608183.1 endonuclease III [Candidatus Fermentibacteraceae bacterium]
MTLDNSSGLLERMRSAIGEMGRPAPMEGSDRAFPVLVGTIISLRTRDAVTRKVSLRVLSEAPTPQALASMDQGRLEELLRPAGFYRQKAGQLKAISSILLRDFGGTVPRSISELLGLPGVGRKTANFVLGMVFGIPSICVDVHVHRISNRLGLVETRSAEETETGLQRIFLEEEWTGINHTMVRFGQEICRPVRPRCHDCPFVGDCPSSTVERA